MGTARPWGSAGGQEDQGGEEEGRVWKTLRLGQLGLGLTGLENSVPCWPLCLWCPQAIPGQQGVHQKRLSGDGGRRAEQWTLHYQPHPHPKVSPGKI